MTAPEPQPGAPGLDGARKRHPACLFRELHPGYEAKLPDGTVLAAMTPVGLERKIRTAAGKKAEP